MSSQTTPHPTSLKVFNGIQDVLDGIIRFIGVVLFWVAPIVLGLLAFVVVTAQVVQTTLPGHDNGWSFLIAILVILSVIGGIFSCAFLEDEGWVGWATSNAIFAAIMWVLVGLSLLLSGFTTILVNPGTIAVADGRMYREGEHVPRGLITVKSLPFNESVEYTYQIMRKEGSFDGGKIVVVRQIDVTLSVKPRPGPALERKLRSVPTDGMWVGSDRYFRAAVAALEDPRKDVTAGQTFPAPAPWLSPVTVTSVKQSVGVQGTEQ